METNKGSVNVWLCTLGKIQTWLFRQVAKLEEALALQVDCAEGMKSPTAF